MSDMVQFDASALKKRVSETIQSNFGMLIPQEQFSKMVDEAINEFFTSPSITEMREIEYIVNPEESSWQQRRGTKLRLGCAIPPFKYMVWCEVHKIAKQELNACLSDKSQAIKELVAKAFDAPSIEHLADMTTEVLAANMAKTQRALAINEALNIFKATLVGAFSQANAYEIAQKINDMPINVSENRM